MDMRQQLRQTITSLLRERGDTSPFQDSDSLILSGRLESIAVMHIAAFLEQAFGLNFSRIGFDQNDFDSVDRLVAVITRENGAS